MTRAALTFALALGLTACAEGGAAPPATPAPPPAATAAPAPAPAATEAPARAPTPLADAHREAANKIIAAALADDGAWAKLSHLTDRIGHRLSGSPQLDAAVAWAQEAMKRDGHENVRAEKVMVPRWTRGDE